jgi:hypothetical protein
MKTSASERAILDTNVSVVFLRSLPEQIPRHVRDFLNGIGLTETAAETIFIRRCHDAEFGVAGIADG